MTIFLARKMLLEFDRDEYFKETDCLINLIKANPNLNYHEIFTNLIIIDLVINLETFIERQLKNFINNLKNMEIRLVHLHENIQKEHLRNIFSQAIDFSNHKHTNEKFKNHIQLIFNCMNNHNLIEIEIDLTLGMGKHGEKEIEKIFKKVGFDNIYSLFLIPSETESILDSQNFLDVKDFIQTLTAKRNVAIHQGVSLHTSFSIEKLASFSKNLEAFFIMITNLLNFSLQHYRNQSRIFIQQD